MMLPFPIISCIDLTEADEAELFKARRRFQTRTCSQRRRASHGEERTQLQEEHRALRNQLLGMQREIRKRAMAHFGSKASQEQIEMFVNAVIPSKIVDADTGSDSSDSDIEEME